MAKNIVRTRRHFLRLLLLLTLGFGAISPASGQQPQSRRRTDRGEAPGYAFVSPNTRENLTLKEAQAGLGSVEEERLIAEARQVACRLGRLLRVDKAVGSWSDGAEHSTVIRVRTNEPSLRYAGSWLGKFARQKAILYFREDSSGGARMYVLVLPRNRRELASIATELDSDGIENRTLVPQKRIILIYVVDLKNELTSRLATAARRLHARFSSLRGKGEFIGDDDREKAQAVFEQEIVKYEGAHPRVRQLKNRCKKKSLPKAAQAARLHYIDSAPTSVLEIFA